MAPLFLTGLAGVYALIGAKQSPSHLNIAFSLALGPPCFVVPFFCALKQIQESSFSTGLIFTQICMRLGPDCILEIEVHAQLIRFAG